jgi:putative ABC transport system ATP-binding protein
VFAESRVKECAIDMVGAKGSSMSLVVAETLTKSYKMGEVEVEAIRGVDFNIAKGSFVTFVGPSGSGKTTLLNLIGCLDKPTSGRLLVDGRDVSHLDRNEGARFRGANIGFIFQDFNLIPVLTVFENVEYPLVMVRNVSASDRSRTVTELLEAVGIVELGDKRPDQLSGGQKQRVAIARALITHPKLVLADEPTANLDHETAYAIIDLMRTVKDELDTTFIFSTHDTRIIENVEVVHALEDGLLTGRRNGGGRSHE